MAEEATPTAPDAAAAAPAPPAEAPAPASVPQAVAAATPEATTPVVQPAEGVATETQAAPEAAPVSQPSLVEMAGKEAPQPTAEKPSEVAAPETVAPAADAPRAPTFEAFTLPEGVTLEDGRFGEFQSVLSSNAVALAAAYKSGDPAQINKAAQDLGQKLLDLHLSDATALRAQFEQNQVKAWNDTRQGWRDEILSDPEIGGSKIEKTLQRIGSVIDTFAQEPSFNQRVRRAFSLTGVGDNPDVVRFMNTIGQALGEASPAPGPSSPAPQQKLSRGERRYRGNGASPAV